VGRASPWAGCNLRAVRRLALAVIAALALAGCGSGNASYVQEAETEGQYVDVGGLTYQVQISRYLNPGGVEDAQYLIGAPANLDTAKQIWFGVWMRVKNYSEQTLTPTNDFTITDTLGNKFTPVPQAPTNVFAYHPIPLGASNVYPPPESAAANGPIQGSLILFKLEESSISNRPLVLHVAAPGAEPATVSLDL
jgi:hypothetical protein